MLKRKKKRKKKKRKKKRSKAKSKVKPKVKPKPYNPLLLHFTPPIRPKTEVKIPLNSNLEPQTRTKNTSDYDPIYISSSIMKE